jgi:hypothetical protein
MNHHDTMAEEQGPTETSAPFDEAWFEDGESRSSAPPSWTRPREGSSTSPYPSIGDRLADEWFH